MGGCCPHVAWPQEPACPPSSARPALSPGSVVLILQKGEIRIINQTTCEKLLPQQITPRMMCVGYLSGGVDACQVGAGRQAGWAWEGGRDTQGLSPLRAIPGAPCPAWRRMGGSSRPAW